MKQKISIIYLIKSTFVQQQPHMILQFFAVSECSFQTFLHIQFSRSKFIRMLPVNRWKFCIKHWIFFSICQCNRTFFRIDPVQQTSVFHMKFFMSSKQLSLQLKLNDCNCFMHLLSKFFFQCIIIRCSLHFKSSTRIIFIYFHCKCRKRKHINSVSIFQNIQISIADTVTKHRCYTGSLPNCCPHPYYIMISPLDIQRMILYQTIHDKMRARASVKNITQNMQMIYNQSLYQFCKCNDEILCTANFNDRIDNRIIISFFVEHFRLFCDQFFNNIRIIRR